MAATTLEGLTRPTPVCVDMTVSSADSVSCGFAGVPPAAVVWIEGVERAAPPAPIASIGSVTLGDTLALEDGRGARVLVIARRARLRFPEACAIGLSVERTPAELVAVLRSARGRGELSWRAFVLRRGDRVRLSAVVEPGLGVRDDLGPVSVELLGRG